MDKFPEAYQRFEDWRQKELNRYKDHWQNIVGEFEEWQEYNATNKQRQALKNEVRPYGIGIPRNVGDFEKRATAITKKEDRMSFLKSQARRIDISPTSRLAYRMQTKIVGYSIRTLKGWQTRGMKQL